MKIDEIKEQEQKLRQYVRLLIDENQRARLTGPSDEETLWNAHVLDCAHALPFLPTQGRVVDVGSGGGLPGIVWAICRPGLQLTLVDSVERKCRGMQQIITSLQLHNAAVCRTRSEELAQRERECYDIASARAVSGAGILAEYLSPLVKVGGRLLAFKGPRADEEIQEVSRPWSCLGLDTPSRHPYRLGDMERCLLIWNKTAPCPTGYPRRPGLAEKSPWFTLRSAKPLSH